MGNSTFQVGLQDACGSIHLKALLYFDPQPYHFMNVKRKRQQSHMILDSKLYTELGGLSLHVCCEASNVGSPLPPFTQDISNEVS